MLYETELLSPIDAQTVAQFATYYLTEDAAKHPLFRKRIEDIAPKAHQAVSVFDNKALLETGLRAVDRMRELESWDDDLDGLDSDEIVDGYDELAFAHAVGDNQAIENALDAMGIIDDEMRQRALAKLADGLDYTSAQAVMASRESFEVNRGYVAHRLCESLLRPGKAIDAADKALDAIDDAIQILPFVDTDRTYELYGTILNDPDQYVYLARGALRGLSHLTLIGGLAAMPLWEAADRLVKSEVAGENEYTKAFRGNLKRIARETAGRARRELEYPESMPQEFMISSKDVSRFIRGRLRARAY